MTYIAKPDYWSLLGLDPGSDQDQLKKAFRREARKWHPDLNVNNSHAEERFKLVNEAYAVLSDPKKRSAWERNITNRENQDPFRKGFPLFEDYISVVLGIRNETVDNSSDTYSIDDEANYLEEDNDKYNRDAEWPTKVPPEPPPVQIFDDVETLVDLTPDEALNGTSVQLELTDRTLVEVDTPPLAGDGWRLRLAGVAKGGRDHFLQLRVRTDDGLRIDGLRVLYKLELFPPDAVMGCAVDVPTLFGPVTLQVPPLSSSGRLLRLRGRGLEVDGQTGDQLVEIVVVIPAEIGESESALYRRLQELSFDSNAI